MMIWKLSGQFEIKTFRHWDSSQHTLLVEFQRERPNQVPEEEVCVN